ncbi:hypothetical protein ScPMuIL_012690 [Solemya velum]
MKDAGESLGVLRHLRQTTFVREQITLTAALCGRVSYNLYKTESCLKKGKQHLERSMEFYDEARRHLDDRWLSPEHEEYMPICKGADLTRRVLHEFDKESETSPQTRVSLLDVKMLIVKQNRYVSMSPE